MSQSVTSALATRAAALREAAGYAAGRSPETDVVQALRATRQVDRRLAFSGDHTVIALAGATGSGKSSLFNAISGTQLAKSGVKRPTTARAMAAVWGQSIPDDLLDWMEVPLRHQVTADNRNLDGLVLLDLPDHDSTELAHRTEVDRLVGLVDGLIWVLDPQKYADDALHSRYLTRFKDYADVMLVVLNQSDRLRPIDLPTALDHLRTMLAAEGLGKAKLLTTSALNGEGILDLQANVTAMVRSKRLAAARLLHDVEAGGLALSKDANRNFNSRVSDQRASRLVGALSIAAGVDQVADAVQQSTKLRGGAATGWPVTSWISKLRPDPLKLLHLDRFVPGSDRSASGSGGELAAIETTKRTALRVTDVQRAQMSAALRDLSEDASGNLSHGWARAIRQASLSHENTLAEELDIAVATTDLGTSTDPAWWRFIRTVQFGLLGIAAFGLLWLLLRPVLDYLGIGPLPMPRWHDTPVPTWILVGSLAAGLLFGLLVSFGVRASANNRRASAVAALRRSVGVVANKAVLTPVNTELERYSRFVSALGKALP